MRSSKSEIVRLIENESVKGPRVYFPLRESPPPHSRLVGGKYKLLSAAISSPLLCPSSSLPPKESVDLLQRVLFGFPWLTRIAPRHRSQWNASVPPEEKKQFQDRLMTPTWPRNRKEMFKLLSQSAIYFVFIFAFICFKKDMISNAFGTIPIN